jgi:uncharacterized membrane protein
MESLTRSMVKTISWRVLATLITTALVYGFTGEIDMAIAIGSIEAFCKMVVYFLHERAWNHIAFGQVSLIPNLSKEQRNV